jgi:CDP-diacylglycerol--glycerol-3-phosphate 3-phosphatidyltransferase
MNKVFILNKGLWVFLGNESTPSVTMIGSPNFGQRSSARDLEAQAILITQNEQLKKALHKEIDLLHQHSEIVSNETFAKVDRKVPYGVRIATAFVKTML